MSIAVWTLLTLLRQVDASQREAALAQLHGRNHEHPNTPHHEALRDLQRHAVPGWFNTTFSIPQQVKDQLAQRAKAYPIPWQEADYKANPAPALITAFTPNCTTQGKLACADEAPSAPLY